MSDIIYEKLVSRHKRPIDLLYRALLYAAIIILALSSYVVGYFGLLAAVVLGFAAYYLIIPRFYVEYEYTLVNKELDIDIIYRKERRKSGMQLDMSQAELVAPLSSPRMGSYQNLNRMDYSANDPATQPYAIIIPHNQTKVCVLIEMNDNLYQHLKMAIPRKLYRD